MAHVALNGQSSMVVDVGNKLAESYMGCSTWEHESKHNFQASKTE